MMPGIHGIGVPSCPEGLISSLDPRHIFKTGYCCSAWYGDLLQHPQMPVVLHASRCNRHAQLRIGRIDPGANRKLTGRIKVSGRRYDHICCLAVKRKRFAGSSRHPFRPVDQCTGVPPAGRVSGTCADAFVKSPPAHQTSGSIRPAVSRDGPAGRRGPAGGSHPPGRLRGGRDQDKAGHGGSQDTETPTDGPGGEQGSLLPSISRSSGA